MEKEKDPAKEEPKIKVLTRDEIRVEFTQLKCDDKSGSEEDG